MNQVYANWRNTVDVTGLYQPNWVSHMSHFRYMLGIIRRPNGNPTCIKLRQFLALTLNLMELATCMNMYTL